MGKTIRVWRFILLDIFTRSLNGKVSEQKKSFLISEKFINKKITKQEALRIVTITII